MGVCYSICSSAHVFLSLFALEEQFWKNRAFEPAKPFLAIHKKGSKLLGRGIDAIICSIFSLLIFFFLRLNSSRVFFLAEIKKINLYHSFIFFLFCNIFSLITLVNNNLTISPLICFLLILSIGVSHGSLDNIKGKKLLKMSFLSFHIFHVKTWLRSLKSSNVQSS